MAINKKIIFYNRTTANFLTDANGLNGQNTTTCPNDGNVGNIPFRSIVFLQDGNIWTHGILFKGTNSLDLRSFVTQDTLTSTLKNYVTQDTLTSTLEKYVTLDTAQTISGYKTFSNPISGDLLGNSTTADRLKSTSLIGSSTMPIYFNGGLPVACSSNLNVNISGTAAKAWADGNGNQINTTYLPKNYIYKNYTATKPTTIDKNSCTWVTVTQSLYSESMGYYAVSGYQTSFIFKIVCGYNSAKIYDLSKNLIVNSDYCPVVGIRTIHIKQGNSCKLQICLTNGWQYGGDSVTIFSLSPYSLGGVSRFLDNLDYTTYPSTTIIDSSSDYEVDDCYLAKGEWNSNEIISSNSIFLSDDKVDAWYLKLSGGTLTGDINTHNIIPVSNDTYTLGNTSNKYKYLYLTNSQISSYGSVWGTNSSSSTVFQAGYRSSSSDSPYFSVIRTGTTTTAAGHGYAGLSAVAGDTVTKNYSLANGFKKHGSSNSYVLLGGGGHKALSSITASISVTTLLSNVAKSITASTWTTLAYCTSTPTASGGTALSNGCYALYIEDRGSSSGTPNCYSGIFTLNSSGTRMDEIVLSESMATSDDTTSPKLIFVGINGVQLQFLCVETSTSADHYLTIKISKLI